ncbi:MAG: flagellin lysine-N-methylase [Oscillospiraceae bacterium]|nr:flagellin lysine-N-methylase [Oscillospiraceae bacterium]
MDKNIKKINITEPAFYKDFACIGSECPVNCCYGWNIQWENNEVERLKAAECSDELKNIIDNAFTFEPNINKYIIRTVNDKCPMLDENNLCRIQRELGVDYMSMTCMGYPRMYYMFHNFNGYMRTCEISCCHVIKMLCSVPNTMRLRTLQHKENLEMYAYADKRTDLIQHPQLKYRKQLFDFFYEILSDESRSIETSVVLASVAARNIDFSIDKGQPDRIPEIIRTLKTRLNDPAQIEKLENARPNLSLKMNFASALIQVLNASNTYALVADENGIPDERLCKEGVEKFNDMFKDRPFAMRNIALNVFITLFMPYRDRTSSLFNNFRYFAAEISAIKFIGAVMAARVVESEAEESFYFTAARIDRCFTHDDIKIQVIYDMLDKFGIYSPAYLMGILK